MREGTTPVTAAAAKSTLNKTVRRSALMLMLNRGCRALSNDRSELSVRQLGHAKNTDTVIAVKGK